MYEHPQSSAASLHTVIDFGTLSMLVSQFCEVIQRHHSLRRAKILSTECYIESIHRFLVMELSREGRKNVWFRLDRRTGNSAVGLALAGGMVPAYDTVGLFNLCPDVFDPLTSI